MKNSHICRLKWSIIIVIKDESLIFSWTYFTPGIRFPAQGLQIIIWAIQSLSRSSEILPLYLYSFMRWVRISGLRSSGLQILGTAHMRCPWRPRWPRCARRKEVWLTWIYWKEVGRTDTTRVPKLSGIWIFRPIGLSVNKEKSSPKLKACERWSGNCRLIFIHVAELSLWQIKRLG